MFRRPEVVRGQNGTKIPLWVLGEDRDTNPPCHSLKSRAKYADGSPPESHGGDGGGEGMVSFQIEN